MFFSMPEYFVNKSNIHYIGWCNIQLTYSKIGPPHSLGSMLLSKIKKRLYYIMSKQFFTSAEWHKERYIIMCFVILPSTIYQKHNFHSLYFHSKVVYTCIYFISSAHKKNCKKHKKNTKMNKKYNLLFHI